MRCQTRAENPPPPHGMSGDGGQATHLSMPPTKANPARLILPHTQRPAPRTLEDYLRAGMGLGEPEWGHGRTDMIRPCSRIHRHSIRTTGHPNSWQEHIGLWGPTCPEPAKKILQKPQQLGSPVTQEREAASASMSCRAQGRREERER